MEGMVPGTRRRNLLHVAAGLFAVVGVIQLAQGLAMAGMAQLAFSAVFLLAPAADRPATPARRVAAGVMFAVAVLLSAYWFTHRP